MLRWIRKGSFRLKAVLAPLCAIACLLAVSAIGFVANDSLGGSLLGLGTVRIPMIIQAAELDQKVRSIHIMVNQSLAWEGAGFKEAKIAELDRRIASLMAGFQVSLREALAHPGMDDVEREQLDRMNTEFAKYSKSALEALEIKNGMLGNAVFYMTTMENSFGQLNAAAGELIRHEHALSDAAATDARSLALRNKIAIVVGLFVALTAAIASAWLLASALRDEFAKKSLALMRAHDAIEEASLTDALTGMRNRRFVEQQLDADISLCLRRYRQWLADQSAPAPQDADIVFFMVDIDHFKSLNDSLGHAAGDRMLAQMRQRLKSACRESDYLVRWGGEEFLVIARGLRRSDGETIAERIRAAVDERPFDIGVQEALHKSCSIGFAAFPFLPSSPDSLSWRKVLELADQALYMAKRGGRDTWVGLEGTERTRCEDVRQWLVQTAKAPAPDAGLRLVRRVASAATAPGQRGAQATPTADHLAG